MKSLYGKFILLTIAIMIMSSLIAFLGVNTFYHQQLKTQNDEKNMTIAKQIASFIETNETLNLDQYLDTQANTGYKIYVVSDQGDAVLYGESFREKNLSKRAIENVLRGDYYHGMRDLPKETFVTGFFSDEMANTVGVPFTHHEKQYALFLRPNIKLLFTEAHYLLGGMFIGMALISLLAMLIVAKKLIKPITELTVATEEVAQENYALTLPVERHDEIGQLARSFHQMTDKLSENDRIRKEFISNVSHDFQTPLQNIKGYAALIKDQTTKESEQKYANIIQAETERLSNLTKQLLLLTSLDQLVSPLKKKSFRLDEQINEIIYKYRWLLNEKQILLTTEIDIVEFKGDPAFLENAWDNLLANALKYTEPCGMIEMTLKEEAHRILFTIKDNGIGMEKKHLPHLFDRFYRVDDSRSSDIEGTGLGLAIVHQVIKLHGGTIDVESEEGEGTTFIICLPKNMSLNAES